MKLLLYPFESLLFFNNRVGPQSGRTIKRQLRQEEFGRMRQTSRSVRATHDIRMRQHLMERSYARGPRGGFDRARWRGFWRVLIQEYLVSAVQNIQFLLRYGSYLKTSPSAIIEQIKEAMTRNISSLGYTELMNSRIGRMVLFGFKSVGYHSLKVRF